MHAPACKHACKHISVGQLSTNKLPRDDYK